jgi:hypothetical protein
MKRIAAAAFAAALVAQILGPFAFAVDGNQGMCDYAGIDCETGQVFDSQDPPHVICINGVCQTATGHGTATYTVTSESVSTNTLYSAGGLIFATSVHDTATVTGSTTATRTVTDNNRIMSPVAYTWEGTSTRTGTYCFTSTGTTTATLTVTGLTGDSLTRTGTGTASGSGTVTATITGTATATGTNTGTGTITGVGTATATASGTFAASSTNDAQSVFVAVGTVADTATHSATGVQTVTVTLATSGIGTTTSTSPPVSTVVTLTATSTVTGTASGTWTNTVTGTSARISDNPTVSDTKTNTHVLGVPRGANKTLNATGTTVLASTDFATSSPMPSAIPLAGTDSRLDIGWLPTGTATDSVVTGADPRLTDARASTNTLYGDGVAFRTGTGTASGTVTSAAVATNPTVVNTSTAVATQTLSSPGGTKTWSTTLTITQTDLATTATGAGIIPMTRTNSKVSSGVIPWGEATDVLPNGDATYDLGSSGASKRWRHGYFSGTVTAGAFSGPGLFINWIQETASGSATEHAWVDVATYSYRYWVSSRIVATGSLTVDPDTSTSGGCAIRIVLDSTVISEYVEASVIALDKLIALSTNGASDVTAGSHAVKLQLYDSGSADCVVSSGGLTISIFSN